MIFLYIVSAAFIVVQLLFIIEVYRHCRYVLKKFTEKYTTYCPKVALIVPCKGIDAAFDRNIGSFYRLDYDNYEIIFVTESTEDTAYNRLLGLQESLKNTSKAFGTRVLVAGLAAEGSQKLHNLLYASRHAGQDAEVFAFADSDVCVDTGWLRSLVYPLRKEINAVSSGYRWYIPLKNNLPTLALSAMNAKVAQMLGPTIFNCAWGGSMAIRVDVFKKLQMDKIWQTAVSDDLTISEQASRAKLRVAFAPACLVASFEQTDWRGLFEFARRQFIITRVTLPRAWWFALVSSIFSIAGLWGFAVLALFSWLKGTGGTAVFLATAVIFLAGQLIRAFLRQRMIFRVLPDEAEKMKTAALADITGGPLWSLLMFYCIFSAAFTRTISWRGVKYKLKGPTRAVRLQD